MGHGPIRCPICNGAGALSWSEVLRFDLAHRYPASVQLEMGTLKVREAIVATSGAAGGVGGTKQ